MNDLARRLRAATHDAVGGAQPPPNLAELVRGPDQRHRARVAVAVPPPGPQRLAWARARAGSAIAERRGPAGRAARSWPRRAARAEPGSRWPGWMPPLAAAAAVAAGMAGAVGASSALHRPGVARPAGPAGQATAYVVNDTTPESVTPIRTATNTALTPIKVGGGPWTITITPDGKTAYVASLSSATVTPIRTATNTALTPVKVGHSAHYTITITPEGTTAYVASSPVNLGRGTVTPIRTATNTPLTPITAVDHPMAIAITPPSGPASPPRRGGRPAAPGPGG